MKAKLVIFFLICFVNGSVYAQSNLSQKLLKNKWITDCIEENCDTINLKRIIPRNPYKYQKVLEFRGANLLYYYHFNPKPKTPYFICGTGELELTPKSTFSIISRDKISIEVDASILSDSSYTYKYKKDFQIQEFAKNELRLVCINTHYYKKESRKGLF